uniref:Solute carrier family 25 member 44 n=1 Tax=Aegilops tauschii subsp. strangulata TaxID=200361 RepID=A0A453KXS9_AEGTS
SPAGASAAAGRGGGAGWGLPGAAAPGGHRLGAARQVALLRPRRGALLRRLDRALPRRRPQDAPAGRPSAAAAATTILRREGPLAFYRGFATSLAGTVPARALYMGALEATRSVVGPAALGLGAPEPAASAAAGAAAGLTAAVAAQVVWTPVDVISQRLMVQGNPCPASRYHGGLDAFRKIVASDGLCGLYRGFGMSILTYAPSNAVWWATYSLSQKIIWSGIGCYLSKLQDTHGGAGNECRDSRWRRGACDHAAGHHQDQDAGHGRPRRANHHWADGAGADQGRRVGRVLQGPRPEVGVHVLVCHHHDHHV